MAKVLCGNGVSHDNKLTYTCNGDSKHLFSWLVEREWFNDTKAQMCPYLHTTLHKKVYFGHVGTIFSIWHVFIRKNKTKQWRKRNRNVYFENHPQLKS